MLVQFFAFGSPAMAALMLAVALAAAGLCRLALAYAQRRGLLDAPGRRRSHQQVTPRGGGISFVLVVALLAPMLLPDLRMALSFSLGLLAIGAIGWWDDHRPLSARLRLLVHVLASAQFLWLLQGPPTDIATLLQFGLSLFWLVMLVNFWNFIDGINGLASLQALIAAGLYAGLGQAAGLSGAALLMLTLSAALLGFLPYNLPRARMFMGDVGSGALGFALGAFALMLLPSVRAPWLLLLPVAPVLVDAGLTLVKRILLGRRWYAAHREHLYQWWVRRGASHVRVSLAYAAFSLLVILPAMILALERPALRLPILIGTYALAAALWLWGRARLRRRRR
ncbi:MraY family glycosyltransferase [Aquimonas voraii]|uniref:UDP-N-acetylmuramyl pentapeptide phosphotransferase/UDP-N-acetylglucosamine-1-phosphate transferase n=1 Tax=Aquimonas voraii TaxID=265719 RepID=A0A1G6UVW2_9GAMM|nr:glycosyltransferase family 4 protein [Aquimonas voraii]SDD45488.1 UDP-N-acetylmuramyl pentapeptide phosphotransferase/UDP-N-acetylglucosamine-1-phosphate transferase [Aquimonas voraii]